MRAWEIENWTQKKLRRKCWDKSEYLHVNKNGHWCFVDKTGRSFGIFLCNFIRIFTDLMSADDVEEYIEVPKFRLGDLVEVSSPSGWPFIGQVVAFDPDNINIFRIYGYYRWFDASEAKLYKPVAKDNEMEKTCENCGTHHRYCDCCFRSKKSDLWIPKQPKLPSKTKNLTWQEAYEAWQDGWEITREATPVIRYYFAPRDQFAAIEIVATDYQLTGKRR